MTTLNGKELHSFDDKLSRYLKGQLTTGEETEFIELLKEDPELRSKAVATARLAKAMDEEGTIADREIISALGEVSDFEAKCIAAKTCNFDKVPAAASMKQACKGFKFGKVILSISIAASIVLCVFGGYKYYKYQNISSLGAEYVAYFPASGFSRGVSDPIAGTLDKYRENIETKRELKITITELKKMWDVSIEDTYNDYTEHMPQIGWLLANAYLRAGEKSEAIEVIDLLISQCPKESALAIQANELKSKIEQL